jgi:hypothetical protein
VGDDMDPINARSCDRLIDSGLQLFSPSVDWSSEILVGMKDGKAIGFEDGFDSFEVLKLIGRLSFGHAYFLSEYFHQDVESGNSMREHDWEFLISGHVGFYFFKSREH